MTASTATFEKSAIFSFIAARERPICERQSRMSGWMPISRSSLTECCVGLVFSSPAVGDERHERDVDAERVLRARLDLQLADGLEERQRLDVADGAADLDDGDVDARRSRRGRAP